MSYCVWDCDCYSDCYSDCESDWGSVCNWMLDDDGTIDDNDISYTELQKQQRALQFKMKHRIIACTDLSGKDVYGTKFIGTFTSVSQRKAGGKMKRQYWEKHEYRKADFDHKANHYMLYDWLRIDRINKNANRGKRNMKLINESGEFSD